MKIADAIIYTISDFFDEAAEPIAKAAASQFEDFSVLIERTHFIKDKKSVDEIIARARQQNSLLFINMVHIELKEYLIEKAEEYSIPYLDMIGNAVTKLSDIIKEKPKAKVKPSYKLNEEYFDKMEAIEFAVKYDDCKDPRAIKKADLVLIGISRTSKTPLSIYLSIQNVKVANIPLVPEVVPPKELFEIPKDKIIGLVTSKEKLNTIRTERLKAHGLADEASYASFERIDYELKYAAQIMKDIGCVVLDVTDKAIEETASKILKILKEVNDSEEIRLQF